MLRLIVRCPDPLSMIYIPCSAIVPADPTDAPYPLAVLLHFVKVMTYMHEIAHAV